MSETIHVAIKALRLMLQDDVDPDLVLISSPGSSGARVSIFRHTSTSFLYAVKCVNGSRVSLVDEMTRRDFLTPFMSKHLPDVLWCQIVDGYEVMISECKGVHSLQALIMSADLPYDQLHDIWNDVVDSLTSMWQESKHEFNPQLCPRFLPDRITRVKESLRAHECIGAQNWDKPVVVNGVEYLSLTESFETINEIGVPKFGVICHGDPQPSNIIVGTSQDWYCVDWEWTGRQQDWRMMASHLFGWWNSRCLTLITTPTIEIGDSVRISYESTLPEHLLPFQSYAREGIHKVLGEEVRAIDVADINRFISLLYFGELRFLHLWNRQIFAIPLLAQAVMLASTARGIAVPINLAF